jgi:hypothetical protein
MKDQKATSIISGSICHQALPIETISKNSSRRTYNLKAIKT